jgi:FKBP-type peptidyl-prolyl cis-trans isomerase
MQVRPYDYIPSGLVKEDVVIGTGRAAHAGDDIVVHYVGKLDNGRQFDSSRARQDPLDFALGAGDVIKGWDEGIAGMKVGGRRKLHIPARLAYGEHGLAGIIPPGATLLFEIELLEILGPRQAPTPIGV